MNISTVTATMTGGLHHLARLMPSLAPENLEVVIVDNASKDGTTNFLSSYDCTIKVNKTNLNFAKANNQGAKVSSGDYIIFLNNDTVVTKGFAMEMYKVFELDPKIAVVGCAIFTMDLPRKLQHAGICFTEDYVPYELGMPIPSIFPGISAGDPRVRSVREVPAVTAACMMVKRDAFFEVGGFDEGYINGWEDTDLILKLREKGYKCWYTGKTEIYHKHFGSTGRFKFEAQNRSRYDSIWVNTGRAREILGEFRNA